MVCIILSFLKMALMCMTQHRPFFSTYIIYLSWLRISNIRIPDSLETATTTRHRRKNCRIYPNRLRQFQYRNWKFEEKMQCNIKIKKKIWRLLVERRRTIGAETNIINAEDFIEPCNRENIFTVFWFRRNTETCTIVFCWWILEFNVFK